MILAALVLYALLGGADFGGGIWDLLAWGPRKREQRALIEHAIGPIWEANHVWLILVVVVLFTAFPAAFAAVSIALFVPLVLLLLGIVLRGAAFTFRTYDRPDDRVQARWGAIFSGSSVLAPLVLGVVVGALASGRLRVAADGAEPFAWVAPFPLAVGLFAAALFAFLAATYLAVEAAGPLREDFRRRALGAGVAVFLCALALRRALLARGAGGVRGARAAALVGAVPRRDRRRGARGVRAPPRGARARGARGRGGRRSRSSWSAGAPRSTRSSSCPT